MALQRSSKSVSRLFPSRRMSRSQVAAWVVLFICMAILLAALTFPLWLPRAVRSVIPDRYIVAYAPEPVAEFIFSRSVEIVPTAMPGTAQESLLLESLASTVSPVGSATPLPTIQSAGPSTQAVPGVNLPTATPTSAFAPEGGSMVTPSVSDLPSSALLQGMTLVGQGFNMCGEATLTIYLSYWGVPIDNRTQLEVSRAIKPHPDDSNTSPHELAGYAESLGFETVVRANGDIDLLRRFIAAGYPVMIERGFDELPEEGWMGHYMLIVGYSDPDRQFAALDSYWGLKRAHPDPNNPVDYWDYDTLNRLWRHFNWTYLIVYPPANTVEVQAIIGDDMNDSVMYSRAAQRLTGELAQDPNDAFGWFSLGTNLVSLGDFMRAAEAYDQARRIGLPFRMLWYQFGPYEAYYQIGRYQDVLDLANFILDVQNYPESEEAFYYRGLVYEQRGQMDAARNQFRRALEYNPNFEPAQRELDRLGG